LAGPYAVTIDGQLAKDYVMEDEQTMRLSLLSGSHDISISGTQVVPEFPIALIGLIVAMVGIVAIIGRTKILGNLKY
jgi:predicted secreted protein with PEFG-CTERM motif